MTAPVSPSSTTTEPQAVPPVAPLTVTNLRNSMLESAQQMGVETGPQVEAQEATRERPWLPRITEKLSRAAQFMFSAVGRTSGGPGSMVGVNQAVERAESGAPQTFFTPEEMGFNSDAELNAAMGDALTVSAIGISAYIAPFLTTAITATGTGIRMSNGASMGEALADALDEGLAIGPPMAELADRLDQPGIATTIREHPLAAELILNLGHDLSLFGGIKGAQAVATRQFDPGDLGPAISSAMREMPSTPQSGVYAKALNERLAASAATRRTFVEQLQALQEGRIAHQQALEINDRAAAQVIGEVGPVRGSIEPTVDVLSTVAEREARQAAAELGEPNAVFLNNRARAGREGRTLPDGREAPGDLGLPSTTGGGRSLVGRQLDDIDRQLGLVDPAQEVIPFRSPDPRIRNPARLLAAGEPITGRAVAGVDIDVVLQNGGRFAPSGRRANFFDQVQATLEREVAASEELSRVLAQSSPEARQVMLNAAKREVLELHPTLNKAELAKLAAQETRQGSGLILYSGIIPDVTVASKRILVGGGFTGGGAALSTSENEYVKWTGYGLMLLGGGSLAGPTIGRTVTAATTKGIVPAAGRVGSFLNRLQGGTLTQADAAAAFARWFYPEFGKTPEFIAVQRQIVRMQARGETLASDYAKEVQSLGAAAAELVRKEAREVGLTRREAGQLATDESTSVRRAVSDLLENEAGDEVLAAPGFDVIARLPEELQDRAINLVSRMADDFNEIGQMQVELGRFAQSTLDARAGTYAPRLYLDSERSLFLEGGKISRGGAKRVDPLRARDDGIPYHVRQDMGEIRELDYRALRGFASSYHTTAVEQAFRTVREMGDRVVWQEHDNAALAIRGLKRQRTALEMNNAPAADIGAVQSRIRAAERSLRELEQSAPEGMKRLPDSDALGSMSGRYVNAEAFDFVQGFETVGTPSGAVRAWNASMRVWKEMMTSMNLPTHVGNVGSNIMLSHIVGGVPWWRADHYRAALRDFRTRGPMYRELRDEGIIGRNFINSETRQSLVEMSDAVQGGARTYLRDIALSESGNVVGVAGKIIQGAGKVRNGLRNLYGAEEEMFKVAVHSWHRQRGKSIQESAAIANEALVDYSQRSGFINLMNKTVMPFFTFTAKVARPLARATVEHPERIPLAFAPFVGIDLIARNLVGVPEVQPIAQGGDKKGAFDIRYTQIPVITEEGEAVFMNTGRFTPYGPFITGSPVEMLLPDWWPQALTPSHPLISATSLMFNRDPLSGQPITHTLQTAPEKVTAMGKEALQVVLPSMIGRGLPQIIQEAQSGDVAATAIAAGGVVGARPVLVPQEGIRERAIAAGERREALVQARRELNRSMRQARTAADTAEVQRRALEFSNRMMQFISEQVENLPQTINEQRR